MKNECLKERKVGDPYEVWVAGSWTWNVLKKWQADDNKPYARWFCQVVTPMTGPRGDLGDVYVSDIKAHARRLTEQEIIARESAAFKVRRPRLDFVNHRGE